MIRIMLVDDHTMVREALRTVLNQDKSMEVVAAVGDGETALATDLVVMGVALAMPMAAKGTLRKFRS